MSVISRLFLLGLRLLYTKGGDLIQCWVPVHLLLALCSALLLQLSEIGQRESIYTKGNGKLYTRVFLTGEPIIKHLSAYPSWSVIQTYSPGKQFRCWGSHLKADMNIRFLFD